MELELHASTMSASNPTIGLKAKSHCSDNETDNDNDAKRAHSIGWIHPRSFNQSRVYFFNFLVFVLVIEACVTGPLTSSYTCTDVILV